MSKILVLLAMLFASTAAVQAEDDVFEAKAVESLRCWRFGLSRTGAIDTTGVPDKTGEKWRTKVGDTVLSSPVLYDGIIYVGSNKGFFALNVDTGEEVWNLPILKGTSKEYSGVVSSACVADGFVYFVGCDGHIYSVNAKDGTVKWKVIPKKSNGKLVGFSPAVAYGLVFSVAAKGVSGFDMETGKEVYSSIKMYTPLTAGLTMNAEYMFGLNPSGDYVPIISVETGLFLRMSNITLSFCRATPALVDGKFYGASVALIGTNPRFPAVAWGELKKDGTSLLKYIEPHLPAKERAMSYASPTVWDGKVFLGCDSGYFYTYDAETLDIISTFKADGLIRSSASVSKQDGMVYFTSYDGNMYALDSKTGVKKWDHKISPLTKKWSEINSCPWVEDGVIYIGTSDGHVVAVH